MALTYTVRCSLGPLVCRIQAGSTETILNDLCSKMLTGKAEQQRDLASIGIKGIIAEAPASAGPVLTNNLSPKLVTGVKTKVIQPAVWGCAGLLTGAHTCSHTSGRRQ